MLTYKIKKKTIQLYNYNYTNIYTFNYIDYLLLIIIFGFLRGTFSKNHTFRIAHSLISLNVKKLLNLKIFTKA
jgi:hypothetical protein